MKAYMRGEEWRRRVEVFEREDPAIPSTLIKVYM
jgi:hypothetical protein